MPTRWPDDDVMFMRRALALAASQLGRTGSNPAVGCVLVKDGKVIGEGATADGGRPHGEAMALGKVTARGAQGATAYVTLEPCAHESARGRPCSHVLIEVGIVRVVCSLIDPDPRTAGKGFEHLIKAGVVVEVGLFCDEAVSQIAEFSAKFKASF
jgi:diaminohydroxyphosphoribosylaminopyrimidine deaminase / 5-amino-6-(5-phosphoribosylamino)uracil reductase